MSTVESTAGRKIITGEPSWFEEVRAYAALEEMRKVSRKSSSEVGRYRIVNFVLGVLLLLLSLPFLLVGMALVWLGDRGPIFFRQERKGYRGKVFKVIKLRTMVVNAEKHSGAVWAGKNDDRITRFGRFLRKTRMDEIPQLWNVIKGDMNVVGPRPERPEFFPMLEQHIPRYRDRLEVRPGITGWAQVNNGYAACADAAKLKQEYDLYYIQNRSLKLDAAILAKTARVVLTGFGAR